MEKKVPHNKKWTYETSILEAKKYNRLSDFRENCMGAYKAILTNNWKNEAFAHMINSSNLPNYWNNKEKCKEFASKYKTRNELRKANNSVFKAIIRNEWEKELLSHMKEFSLPKGYWDDFNNCKNEVLKYKSFKELRQASNSLFKAIKRNGWEDELFSHIERKFKPRGYWTLEKCLELATNCKTHNEFRKLHKDAYYAVCDNGWTDNIWNLFEQDKHRPGYWTYDNCKQEAVKYTRKVDFQKKSGSVYNISRKNGWLDDICSHMIEIKKPNKYWDNFENCKNEALKFIHRTEFKNKASKAYEFARRNNWLDDICTHMLVNATSHYRYIYAFEFPDNHVYVGLTYNINGRYNAHMSEERSSVFKHIQKTALNPTFRILTENPVNKNEASILEGLKVKEYKDNGWFILNKCKTGGLGGNSVIWSLEKCLDDAKKYNTYKDFRLKSTKAYGIAIHRKWLPEIKKLFNN